MNKNATWVVTAAIVSIAAVFMLRTFLNPYSSPGTSDTPIEANRYAAIKASHTLKAGYAVGAPLFMVDPNSREKSGIFYEILEAAAKNLELKVDWTEEVGYGEMIQGLSDRRYDVVGSGVWVNGARSRNADFTNPIYFDAVLPYVRTRAILDKQKTGVTRLISPTRKEQN